MISLKKAITCLWKEIWCKREKIYILLIWSGVALIIALMFYRVFFGTEITDEAHYVSEAKEMLNGNIPFACNNSSKALGFAFLLIPVIAIYKSFVPDLAGIFLCTRLCFVIYKVIIWYVIYRVFQRRLNKTHALLVSALIIPGCTIGYIQNFSYNTVPVLNMFLAGCLLFDIIEQNAPHKWEKILAAGFMTGIACFANPGWTVALLVFLTIILIRITDPREKMRMITLFCIAFMAEVLIVTVPICIQTSFADFWEGVYLLFINPIPVDPLNPGKTLESIITSFKGVVKNWIVIFVPVCSVTYIFSRTYIYEDGRKLSKRQYMIFSITIAMFFCLGYIAYMYKEDGNLLYQLGFAACGYMIVFAMAGAFKEEKLIWYLGIYPLLYTLAAIIMLSYSAGVSRFINSYTILPLIIFTLLKNKSELVRLFATVIAIMIIVSLGYANFHYIYRDAKFEDLNFKVESGVYKGLYTSQARANDLPELEEYLNKIIDEDDTYAFRDNVPSAYLMMHKGKVCEISTWDALQYSYNRNSPSLLFDYYKRRSMIPDKIIYVDYGRDDKLSIEDPEYRYNDWVNEYYDLVEDIELNETFSRVMVYQYNGTFDGDYQYWIDAYWKLVG